MCAVGMRQWFAAIRGLAGAWLLLGTGLAGAAPAAPAPAPASAPGLLVVGRQAFEPALREFLAWKNQLLPTVFHSLESVLGGSEGVDDPEKVKRFLYSRWRECGTGYVLLVGDVDVFPVRYMVLDRITPAAADYAFYPSDLYYADVARPDGSFDDWNGQRESFHAGYFGEVRGEKNKEDPINFDRIDYQPEIAVGRWPASTPVEVKLVAAKTMATEKVVLSAQGPHPPRAAFVAADGWVDCRDRLDLMAARLEPAWLVQRRFYADARRPKESPPDPAAMRALLDSGMALVVHAGHGQPDGWERCLGSADIDLLHQPPPLPVLVSAGCSTALCAPLPPYTAYVDVDGKEHAGTDNKEVFAAPPPPPAPYQPGKFNLTGLGEQMLRRNAGGAVAYIGCNTGSQPCAVTLVEGFVGAWADARVPRLGDCWREALRYYHAKENLSTLKPTPDWYPPSIFFQGMKFMLFGDPSLRLPGRGR